MTMHHEEPETLCVVGGGGAGNSMTSFFNAS